MQFTPRSSAFVRATIILLRVSHAHKSPEVSPVKANTPSNEKQQAATLQRGRGEGGEGKGEGKEGRRGGEEKVIGTCSSV